MKLKPGQMVGVDMPEGQRALSVRECHQLVNRPGMREAMETALRADVLTMPDGSETKPEGYRVLEMSRSTHGKGIEVESNQAEKVAAEKERLANSC